MTPRESPVDYSPTIKEMPEDERPRERLLHSGPGSLKTAELMAILFRTGTADGNAVQVAEQLLQRFGGLARLSQASVEELMECHGIGQVKAIELKAALELGRRLLASNAGGFAQVKSPADVANLLAADMSHLEQEHLNTVLLDTKNHVLKVQNVYKGSLNSASVRIGEVFREAIRANAAAVIVAHNHPSGDPTPSPEDIQVTRQLVLEAGKLLDIQVLDHLVIGSANRWVSLKERGLAF